MELDESSEQSVAEQLRDALSKASVRVIDLFREWDDDNNGKVSRAEFHKAMGEMKFDAPPEEIDRLFDEWDPDGSGVLELNELSKLLRRGSTVKLDEKLQAGGAGAIQTQASTKHALRKGKLERKGSLLLQQFDVDEESDKSVAEQVRSPIRHTKLSAPAKGSPHRPPHVAASRCLDQGLRARDRPLPRMG